MSTTTLTAALLLGVLLPASFSRPGALSETRLPQHTRRRLNYLYTCGAFAAMSYVYTTATILTPVHPRTPAARNALVGGALILALIALANHLPPLLTTPGTRAKRITSAATSVILGIIAGGFLATDEIFTNVHQPMIAAASWAVLCIVVTTGTYWHSGLSPKCSCGSTSSARRAIAARRPDLDRSTR